MSLLLNKRGDKQGQQDGYIFPPMNILEEGQSLPGVLDLVCGVNPLPKSERGQSGVTVPSYLCILLKQTLYHWQMSQKRS
jgi:hypothetical protein